MLAYSRICCSGARVREMEKERERE